MHLKNVKEHFVIFHAFTKARMCGAVGPAGNIWLNSALLWQCSSFEINAARIDTVQYKAAIVSWSYDVTVSHFTVWITLLLSPNTVCTHRPQGVSYRGHLHVLKYLLLLLLMRKEW